MDLVAFGIHGGENGINKYYLIVFSVNGAFAYHFMALHNPIFDSYRSTYGIGYVSISCLKWWANSVSYPFNSQRIL